MIRYTIEVKSRFEDLDLKAIQTSIEGVFTKTVSLYKVRLAVTNLTNGFIFIEVESDLNQLNRILGEIKTNPKIMSLDVKLGWIIPLTIKSLVTMGDEETDPYYYESKSQIARDGFYKYGIGGQILLIFYVICLTASLIISYFGFLRSDNIQTIIGMVFTSLLVYSFFSILSHIKCDEFGVEFKYLLKPKIIIPWSEIQSVKIFQARGEWVAIDGNKMNVKFPLSTVYDISTSKNLVKTILTRAHLVFVGASNGIVYQKSKTIFSWHP